MDNIEVETKLKAIFQAVLGTDDISALNKDKNVKWDSLHHAELILSIQHKFKVKFNVAEISTLNSYAEILALIRKKLA
jgi:acyl carrier protein